MKIIPTICLVSIIARKRLLSYIVLPHFSLTVTTIPVNCALSCNSCPASFDMSIEDVNALEAVAKYGEPQRVEVRI